MDSALFVPELSQPEKQIRDAFVEKFLEIRDYTEACLRMGFLPSIAEEYAKKFRDCQYVRNRIAEETVKQTGDKYNQHLAQLEYEAYNNPSPTARVAALRELVARTDPNNSKGSGAGEGNRSGVMLVPMLQDAESWSKSAEASQAALKQSVRD